MAGRRKLIIDSDAGVDDANAILMALGSPDVDVIAITTVSGNTTAPQSGRNVLRVLQLMNRLDVSIRVELKKYKFSLQYATGAWSSILESPL